MIDPILSITIPTYNRAFWLKLCLEQLLPQIKAYPDEIELIISDNCSPDNTEDVVKSFLNSGFKFQYVRNSTNIGSDANIAQCFNLARGRYVLILGDDDLFIDDAISKLLVQLRMAKFGVVCIKPYGFDNDFRSEYPGSIGNDKLYDNAGNFLAGIGPLMTLISGSVINKSILNSIDANDYCGENLVQVHLVIQAAVKAKQNLFMNHYMIGCKRNNSGGYDFAKVFVENVGKILDLYTGEGLTRKDVLSIERKFIVSYFPFYLMKQRYYRQGDISSTFKYFSKRYGSRFIFYLWLYPILKSPRWIAVLWGALATLVGRVLNGELIRGWFFFKNKLRSFVS
jgi:abequosyltransferase